MPRAEQGRGLRAVVFLDTVGSTQVAAALGDERWQVLLRRELQILRHVLKEYGGREVDVAGDGLFALFLEPAPAIRFAAAATEAVREVGLEIRAGIHVGELEFADGRPRGIVVHTGARAMGFGGPGQVIVTGTVKDLVAGARFGFDALGAHELKGVPGIWTLFGLAVVDEASLASPLSSEEAESRRVEASGHAPAVKRRAFVIGAGVGAMSLGAVAFLTSRSRDGGGQERSPSPVLSGQRLFRYDVASDTFTRLPTVLGSTGSDFFPSIAVGEGAVWTGDFYLHRVDPEDGSEILIDLGHGNSDFVGAVTTGFDDVWVVTGWGLHRVSAGDGHDLDSRRLDTGGWQTAIAIEFGSVWITTPGGTLFRVDPGEGLPIMNELQVGEVLSGVVRASGLMWASDEFGDVIPVDPTRDRALRPIRVGGAPKGLAATERRLWAIDPKDHSVHVVDIESRTLLRSIPIGGEPVDVATGLGSIWVADVEGRLIKIDEASLEFADIPVAGPVAALAIDVEREAIWLRTTHS